MPSTVDVDYGTRNTSESILHLISQIQSCHMLNSDLEVKIDCLFLNDSCWHYFHPKYPE